MAKVKGKAGRNPGLSALRKRYKANADRIKTISKRDTEYQTYIRAYRSEVAKAKKAGLVAKTIDARKVTPSSNVTRAIEKAHAVISGQARAQKVSKNMARQLRDEGYEVIKGRVILSKGSRINKKGELVIGKGKEANVLQVVRATADIENQIKKIMDGMSDNSYITVPLPGGNQSNYFAKWQFQEFLDTIYRYLYDKDGKMKMKYLYVQKLNNREELEEWDNERVEAEVLRKANRQVMSKKKRKTKRRAKVEQKAKRARKRKQ